MSNKPFAEKIVKTLVDAGYTAYFAGGWVRDYLMKHPSDDIDIATNASVDEVCKLFPKTIPVGVAFGIVIVVQDGHNFEVATFRKDRGYVDGRRPTGIDPAGPEEDAQRRDFTINGMFYDPLKEKLYDYVGGQEDLKKGIIRAIGDPHARFLEDRLRMMRAVRYSTRFGFPIDQKTMEAIMAHSESLLPAVAIERVWMEFKKMSQFAHFDTGLLTLHRLNLLGTIFPSLKNVSLGEIKNRLKAIPDFPKGAPPISELLELFPQTSLDDLFELCDYLKLSREDRDFVISLHHAKNILLMPEDWQNNLEKYDWAKFYADPHSEICIKIMAAHIPKEQREAYLKKHQERRSLLDNAVTRIQTKKPVVKADDLIKEGIPPSKKLGELLQEAERISVNDSLEDKEEVLKLLRKSSSWEVSK